MIDYTPFKDGRLPAFMEEGTRLWIEEGIRPGHFLCAVIEGDLYGAVAYADGENQKSLVEWVKFFTKSGYYGQGILKTWKGTNHECE